MVDDVRQLVRERYAASARSVAESGCCSTDCCSGSGAVFGAELYEETVRGSAPDTAFLASLGCGNPTAVAELAEGETVLDLGSGGGLDVILSARRVGPGGKVYGLDMTDEMLALALENKARAAVDNVEFLKGYIEEIPLPANTVDVVISNCVLNLSPDKSRVFAEILRVLKPGGRLAVTDVVADTAAAEEPFDPDRWSSCISGALTREEFRSGLAATGFEDIELVDTHPVAQGYTSSIIRGRKPASGGTQPMRFARALPVVQESCC